MRKLRSIGRYIIEDKTLGKGNFAVVELATHSITKSKVAIKVIDRHKIKEDYVRQNLGREARILAQLRHPNVVRLYETISSNSLYCLVTEYAGGGDLLSFVRSQRDGRLRESDARPFVRQLVSALHHLHERGVVHRDLKMENIMLDNRKKNIKIVDFGLSNCFSGDQLLRTHCGSPEYAAPELFTAGNDYYGPEVDIWSLGINVYAMVCGKLPFTTPHSENRRQRLLQQLQYGLGPIQEKEMSKLTIECRKLLHDCIEPNPQLRAPLLDVEDLPWMTDKGRLPFFPYQQPRKDRRTRELVICKMSALLNVSENKIDSNVHEYRLDEVSAMYNLLMEDHLNSKRYFSVDHTAVQEGKRPLAVGNDGKQNDVRRSTETKTTISEAVPFRVSLRTPTIIGMVRPSRADPGVERRLLKSADFELRAIDNAREKSSKRRPKTSYFTQSSSKAKPMGNATTQNILLARSNNFGLPLQQQQRQLCEDCKHPKKKTSRDDQKVVAIPNAEPQEETGSSQDQENSSSGLSNGKQADEKTLRGATDEADDGSQMEKQIDKIDELQEEGEGDEAINESIPDELLQNDRVSDKRQYAAISKSPNVTRLSNRQQPVCDDCVFDELNPNPGESQKEVNVIDMVQYFNSKHGYRVSETPFVFPKTKVHRKSQKESLKESYSDDQVTSDSAAPSSQAVAYKRCTPYSGSGLRKVDETQPPTAIDIKLPRNDEGYQSDSESERGRSATPQKARWRPRFYNMSMRSPSSGRSSPSSRRTPRHSCRDSSPPPPCRTPDRPLYCTPVASFQTSQDLYHATPIHADDEEHIAEEDVTKGRMPQRLCWKKSGAPDMSAWKKVAELKTKPSTTARELIQRNGVHESYPLEDEMRIHSGRLRTGPDMQSTKPSFKSSSSSSTRPSQTATCHPATAASRQTGVTQHPTCSTKSTYNNAYRMDKYSGQYSPHEQPDDVIDLSKQYLLSLLQEASATLENATKIAERKQIQAELHYYHQASHQRQPIKPWQKAMHQLKPHHHDTVGFTTAKITDALDSELKEKKRPTVSRPATVRTLGKSRRSGASSAGGGRIAKQLGQRVTYEEGTLNPKTGRPPTVSKQRKQPVFNMESTRPSDLFGDLPVEKVSYRLPKMNSDLKEVCETPTMPTEWSVGYTLERKLSNTLKGGDRIAQMRRTPYAM